MDLEDVADALRLYHVDGRRSVHHALVSMCSIVSYSVLSDLTVDMWSKLNLTDWLESTMHCCLSSSFSPHKRIILSNASRYVNDEDDGSVVSIQREWTRYLFVLRDRMIAHPETIPTLLPPVLRLIRHGTAEEQREAMAALAHLCASEVLSVGRSVKANFVRPLPSPIFLMTCRCVR